MSDTSVPASRSSRVLDLAYFLTAVFFFVYLFVYYATSEGGPALLAFALIPVTYILYTLDALRKNEFYPSLPAVANFLIAAAYIVISIVVAVYMVSNYEEIGTVRAGFWNATDITMGALMVVLIMEYARKRHMVLFVLNVLLILYAVYGRVVPGMFFHPGLSWERVVTAMSVEMSTGIYSNLAQLALTVIGSFILVLSVLRAFGCVESILKFSSRLAVRSAHALPQSAVIGSMAVGTVSGSGAANAITVGSATIPAMIGCGMPPTAAGAIETASSLGGQLMPPVMGISAFLMAEFLGVSYFDVVARGYAPALIYYVGVSVSVYLLSTRYRTRIYGAKAEVMSGTDWANLAAFAAVVAGLILIMAIWHVAPMIAAYYVFIAVAAALLTAHVVVRVRRSGWSWRVLAAPLVRFIDNFASMGSDLALLLATLSIMTGAFVITGVPTKVGSLLLDAAGVNLAAMVVVAFFFGALLGTGLPPAPTYIITALVIAPPMIKVGVDPWVVHFFAFFLGVWGEVTPPTSISAAITSKIAGAPFLRTLFRAITICFTLFILMAGVFTRPALVMEPGLAQIGALLMLLTATIGASFSLQAQFADRRVIDVPLRLILAALVLVVIFHPDQRVAALTCIPIGLFIAYWVILRRDAPLVAEAEAG